MSVSGIDPAGGNSYDWIMTRESILKHALSLTADERVRLVDELLESIVDPDNCSELSEEEQTELLRRLDADRTDPDAAVSWEEAEKRITSQQ